MRLALVVILAGAFVGCGGGAGQVDPSSLPHQQESAIVGGAFDAADPAVIELFFLESYPSSSCNGNSTCLQSCASTRTGRSCSSGTECLCETGATCSSELIGPHTLMTAGHCTDLTAGGTLSGPGGPAMTLCTTAADANLVLGEDPTAPCNLVAFAIFNNHCTTNDDLGSCEYQLIDGADGGGEAAGGGNFILIDQLVNPGYDASVAPPGDDNDLGLAHLPEITLSNGGAEPAILYFNRADEGSACSSLGSLTFIGYGLTSSQGAISGVKMSVSHQVEVLDPYHNYEGDPDTVNVSLCSSLGSGEPTCSGDSGGPSLNEHGVIMGITSVGDSTCQTYGQDTRIDAHASWIDSTMTAASWGDPKNEGPYSDVSTGCSCSSGDSTLAFALVPLALARAGRRRHHRVHCRCSCQG